jgi:hypothetical protein
MTTTTSSNGERGTAGHVGRIFRPADGSGSGGASFQLTGRKSCGQAPTLEEAKADTPYSLGVGRALPARPQCPTAQAV